MSSMFSENTISTIKNIRKGFLWTAVIILIGEVVAGAIIILTQAFGIEMAKIMGTFGLCAITLFLGVNNFTRMEKGNVTIQSFALASLVLNMIWLILAILLIWEVIPFYEECSAGAKISVGYYKYYVCQPTMTIAAKLFLIALNTAVSCFFISNVLAIEETVKPVKPLKITALVCELYCAIYYVIVTIVDTPNALDSRWVMLSMLAGFAFLVMAIAALIVSRSGRKKNEAAETGAASINSAEMQSQIREMVEKEVQERMKAEKEKTEENKEESIEEKIEENKE